MRWTRAMMMAGLTTMVACGGEDTTDTPKGELVEPVIGAKADVADKVVQKGNLSFNKQLTAEFTEDLEFHGVWFAGGEGAKVKVGIERRGTSSRLDTTLFVYGPQKANGQITQRLAFDDDSGWGKQSRISDLVLPEDGRYLIVVGTRLGDGRGRYNLGLECLGEDCGIAPPPADTCIDDIRYAIEDCVDTSLDEHDWGWDYDVDDARHESFEMCVTDFAGDIFDSECGGRWDAPELWCPADYDTFKANLIAPCAESMADDYPPAAPQLALSGLPITDLMDEIGSEFDCDYCWMEASAFKHQQPRGETVTLQNVINAVGRSLGAPGSEASYSTRASQSTFEDAVERLAFEQSAAYMEEVFTLAQDRNYMVGTVSWSYYAAAGAEAWVDITIAWFPQTRTVVAIKSEAGET